MNHEKINSTVRQEQIIEQWKEKYEKVVYTYVAICVLINYWHS